MFFPRQGARRLRLTVKAIDGEWVRVAREDGSEANVALDRLLARDEADSGLHYRFHGWKRLPRGYRTEMIVASVSGATSRCALVLPEWDPDTEIEVPLSAIPAELRIAGATGSCRADLTSPSAAALDIHACTASKVRGLSRAQSGPHPDVLAEGQEYRRRSDRRKFRLLDVDPASPTVPAWSGSRVVRLDVARLLALRLDGEGAHYLYLGGGIAATRRRRAENGRRSRRTR
ncbi:MAG TPA: hypothetical protein VF245_00775 [Solirubrobacterales bacterium]